MSPSALLRMDIIGRIVDSETPDSLIEVGAGMGAAAWHLSRSVKKYTAYEPDADSFRVAAERLRSLPGVSIENDFLPSEPEGDYGGLLAFEVLEHIEDDLAALAEWLRWVRPGGFVVLSVPARQSRFSPYDEAVGHYRRYDAVDLRRVMAAAGLVEIELKMYGMPLGYALEWVRKTVLLRRLPPEADVHARTGRSGRSFQPRSSGRLMKYLTYPFVFAQRPFENSDWGIGWVAVGKRPL